MPTTVHPSDHLVGASAGRRPRRGRPDPQLDRRPVRGPARHHPGVPITTAPSPDPVTASTGPAGGFRALTRAVDEAGLLRRRPGAYAALIGLNAALVAGGVVLFTTLGASWWQPLTAVYWGIVSTQLAFIGHDAGHKQILTSRRGNDVIGYVHGALVGMSYGGWVGKHNRHHARPNHADSDPDIDIPLLAFDAEQAAGKRGLIRWAVAHQAVLFLPLLLLEGWSLHVTAALAAYRGELPRPRLEAGLLVGHAVAYVAAVLLVLTPLQAVVFVVVHQGVWGLCMGLAFAPNHKGMPIVEPGRKLDHLHKQVLTSRNVRGGVLTDLALGGLNHQIEHHLFPWMPRPNLARARPVVRSFCAEHDLPYTETGVLGSYTEVLRHLHAVGAPLRDGGPSR